MIFKLPTYAGAQTHLYTNWYIFPTNDFSDIANSVYTLNGTLDTYKNVVNITIDIPVGEVYYLVAYLYMSDSSVVVTKPLPITSADMGGKKLQEISYGVETPTVKIIANNFRAGGDIIISSTGIRPKDNVFKEQVVVVTDDLDSVIYFEKTSDYNHIIPRNVIPTDIKDIYVYIAHVDSTNTISNFGKKMISVADTDIGLKNDIVIPFYDYRPVFVGGSQIGVRQIIISEDGKIVYKTNSALIPKNILDYNSYYLMQVTFNTTADAVVEEFYIKTINSTVIDYVSDYSYVGVDYTTDYMMYSFDNCYVDVTPRNLLCGVLNDKLLIKYFNNDTRLKYMDLPYSATGPSETRYLAGDIVYVKYPTVNGLAVIIVNIGLYYTVPTILTSIEITDADGNECVLTSDDNVIYIRDKNGVKEIVSMDITTRNIDILSDIPQEYIVIDNPQLGFEGIFNKRYSMLIVDDLLYVMDRNIGLYSYDLFTSDYKFLMGLSVQNKGKTFIGTRLHGGKIAYTNANSVIIEYDQNSTTIVEHTLPEETTVIANMMAYSILLKTVSGTHLLFK